MTANVASNPWKKGGKFSSNDSTENTDDGAKTNKRTPATKSSGANRLKPLSEQIQATSVPNLQKNSENESSSKNDDFGSSTNLSIFLAGSGGNSRLWTGEDDDEAESGPIRLGKVVDDSEKESDEATNWSLSKREKDDLRNKLSDVIGRRSVARSPSPNPAPKIEMPKILPPIPPSTNAKKSESIAKPSKGSIKASSKRVDDMSGPDIEEEDAAKASVTHLVKPSSVKANQPKCDPVHLLADSKTPKNVSKETLLDLYNSMWDNADDIPEPEIVKCGLPEAKRPTEEENLTDVEDCITRLEQNDPTLKEINLNNMKRTPVPQIQRLIESLKDNEHLEKLSLANLALTDMGLAPLIEALQVNTALKMINLETNFLTGDFFIKLFVAMLKTQTLQEVKAVNQSNSLGQKAETAIMKAIHQNRGLTKVSMTLRIPEVRQKIDQAVIRNGELKRLKRQIEAMEAKK